MYSLEQLIETLDDYLDTCDNQNTLGDHIASQLIQSEENVIYSSMKLDLILRSIEEHRTHPTIQFYQKLIGLNGFKILD